MDITTTVTPQGLSATETRILALASIAASLEFYDFIIFVFFAPGN
jgi:hypothetical protein